MRNGNIGFNPSCGLNPFYFLASQRSAPRMTLDVRRFQTTGQFHFGRRCGHVLSAVISEMEDQAVRSVRNMTAWIGAKPRLAATVIQTVGSKGYDGSLLARVQEI
jgi:hypothetical protein